MDNENIEFIEAPETCEDTCEEPSEETIEYDNRIEDEVEIEPEYEEPEVTGSIKGMNEIEQKFSRYERSYRARRIRELTAPTWSTKIIQVERETTEIAA